MRHAVCLIEHKKKKRIEKFQRHMTDPVAPYRAFFNKEISAEQLAHEIQANLELASRAGPAKAGSVIIERGRGGNGGGPARDAARRVGEAEGNEAGPDDDDDGLSHSRSVRAAPPPRQRQ